MIRLIEVELSGEINIIFFNYNLIDSPIFNIQP